MGEVVQVREDTCMSHRCFSKNFGPKMHVYCAQQAEKEQGGYSLLLSQGCCMGSSGAVQCSEHLRSIRLLCNLVSLVSGQSRPRCHLNQSVVTAHATNSNANPLEGLCSGVDSVAVRFQPCVFLCFLCSRLY